MFQEASNEKEITENECAKKCPRQLRDMKNLLFPNKFINTNTKPKFTKVKYKTFVGG